MALKANGLENRWLNFVCINTRGYNENIENEAKLHLSSSTDTLI